LQTLKYPDELESLMEKISNDARLAEQEMGVSTLEALHDAPVAGDHRLQHRAPARGRAVE
jgi:hypothetical protein